MIKPLIYAPSKPIRKRKNVFLQRLGTNALFLLPALFFFTCFVIYPLLSGVYYSMTNWNGIDLTPQFVGLQNFLSLWHDAEFLSSMRVTLTFAFFVTLIQNSLALLLALALNRFMRFSAAFRVLFLIPTLISILAMGYIWSYIYSPLFGFVDAFLIHVGLSQWAQDWLGDPHFALGTIIFSGSWQWCGFNMIIYMAALQLVPTEFYEAASMDGANRWRKFRDITFPLIAPSFTINLVLILIGGLRVFDIIVAMTGGGPAGMTRSVFLEIYRQAFLFSRFGYSSAMVLVVSLIILAISVTILHYLRKREVAY
ncbi:MAG TPA: sugar ABC transporter permease [Ktedonobacteraceae bacterium]|nr:sugar ABC transporter permease [Ktedonobacteraceae bacterium]